MSQSVPKGRNANSLTLNNPTKPSAKTKTERTSVDETESNQKAKDVIIKDTKDTGKVNNEDKQSKQKDKATNVEGDEKCSSKTEDKLKNGSSNTTEESNTKISNGSHKNDETSTAEEKKTRETRQKSTTVKDNKSENAETAIVGKSDKNEKSTEKPAATNKEKDKDSTKSNQKDKKNDKEGKQPSKSDTPKKDKNEAKSSTSPKDKDIKDVQKSKPIDSPKPKSKIESTPPKSNKVDEKQEITSARTEDNTNVTEPLVWENEEMEPLLMQVDVDEKTPLKNSAPTSTSTPTPSSRILRMCSGPPERNESPMSLMTVVDPKNNTSTCVNLSTLTNPHSPDKSYGAKVRSVSGRRPMLREISYQNSYREHVRNNDTYSPNVINESSSSGYLDQSQRSINTSSFVARKRYNEDYIVKEIDSPKRPRLDVSGLLTLVSSPVTMLRNRLARARIQSSTPNSKSNINKDDIEIDTVTASCIDEPKELDNDEVQDEYLENDEYVKEHPNSNTSVPDDIEIHTDIQVKILKEENKLGSSPFVPNDAIKKKWNCRLM